MKKILTIAGSDSSGGAGIQADIKTITAHKMYAMSVITALTAQNTVAVTAIVDTEPYFVAQQMDAIFTDIRPDAVKIGMVSNEAIINAIAMKLKEYKACHIVLDPVMVSTSGYKLLTDEAQGALIAELIPLCDVLTPNAPEAEILCGFPINSVEDMERAALEISAKNGCAVLVKGGHLVRGADCATYLHGNNTDLLTTASTLGDPEDNASSTHDSLPAEFTAEMWATDVLCENGTCKHFTSKRIFNPNCHGTGCTLSSAIACNLAAGRSLAESVTEAKSYLNDALASMLDLGKGSGPIDHTCRIRLT